MKRPLLTMSRQQAVELDIRRVPPGAKLLYNRDAMSFRKEAAYTDALRRARR